MKYALDTENGPFNPAIKQTNAYALEPYREEFYVKMVAIVGKKGHRSLTKFVGETIEQIDSLENPVVYCHNAIYDIAVLIKFLGYNKISHIEFRDTSILAKWLNNSQKDKYFIYSLRNCVAKWMEDHPDTPDFLDMKDVMEDSDIYWMERAMADTSMTLDLAVKLESLLPKEQAKGYLTECKCLLPLARGYMQGILIDHDVVDLMKITYQAKINQALRAVGLTEDVVNSPSKLSKLLFNDWDLVPGGLTPKGKPSTNAASLKVMLINTADGRLTKIMEAKSAITVRNKYINGFIKSKAYLGTDTIHPVPRLFNSYTGRLSYTSKMLKKHQVGIALHQLPRKDKMVKEAMIAPPGYKFFYADYAAQELRLMAQHSADRNMLDAFHNNMDLHSITTENIYATPYDELVEGNRKEIPEIVDQRNCGKLTNLSSQYRIRPKGLQTKFLEQYDKIVTLREATHYLNSYMKSFPGIEKYWDKAIRSARSKGYSTSLMDRRFYINKLDWSGESSAINEPIQGSGADLTVIAIGEVQDNYPDYIFQITVHDSLCWLMPEDDDPIEFRDFLNGIDYSKYISQEILLDFPLDCAVGPNLGSLTAI